MIISININDQLVPTLDKLAADNNVTPEQFVRRMILTFIASRAKTDILTRLKRKNLDQLINLNV